MAFQYHKMKQFEDVVYSSCLKSLDPHGAFENLKELRMKDFYTEEVNAPLLKSLIREGEANFDFLIGVLSPTDLQTTFEISPSLLSEPPNEFDKNCDMSYLSFLEDQGLAKSKKLDFFPSDDELNKLLKKQIIIEILEKSSISFKKSSSKKDLLELLKENIPLSKLFRKGTRKSYKVNTKLYRLQLKNEIEPYLLKFYSINNTTNYIPFVESMAVEDPFLEAFLYDSPLEKIDFKKAS